MVAALVLVMPLVVETVDNAASVSSDFSRNDLTTNPCSRFVFSDIVSHFF
jgi:hypothetical protein